jgi:L-tartrate/succinate antiporter
MTSTKPGKLWRAAVPLGAWAVIASLPTPAGLEPDAWRYFALFAAVLVGLILEPIPTAAIGLLGVTVATVLGYVRDTPAESIRWGLSGFSNTTVWLIFGAFMLSMGYERSGLGRRVALSLVKRLGGRTLGLGYAIALADLLLAPGMPSNTARSGGTIYPVIRNIPALFGSQPGPTARRIGAYLMWTAFASTAVTSSMFMTALAPSLLAVALVKETAGLDITWGQWLVGALPVGAVLLGLTPLLVYFIYPPQIRSSEEAPSWAAERLTEMGSVSPKERAMGGLVLLALALWIFGGRVVSATTVVLIIICLMIVTRVLEWDEILGNKTAWNMLVWFATLVTLAGGLNEVGFVRWFAEAFSRQLDGYPVRTVMGSLVAFFFLIHYMFASLTAHTAAVLPVVLAVGVAVPGLPVLPFSLLLCYSLGLMGVITPYATGPAPVYYASGFVSRTDFWRLGLIFGLVFLSVLLAVGMPYLTWLHGG